jgi:hypothetical protein
MKWQRGEKPKDGNLKNRLTASIAVVAIENRSILSHLQRLAVVKVRGIWRQDLPAANPYRRSLWIGYSIGT